MLTKEFVTLKLDEITPYENNPRINDDAVDDVIASIQQCENLDPIEIDENNVILSGHTRLNALKKLGYTETECLRYTGLTDKQKRKYRLLTNKTGEKALWDIELLPMELNDLDFDGYCRTDSGNARKNNIKTV
jgi:ParB-like chromosome segregation protein Spo0J